MTAYCFLCNLVKPPNVALYEDTDEVDKPHERDTNDQQYNSDYQTNHVVFVKALADSVDPPYNVECGDAKQDLCYQRQVVDRFDQFLHFRISK